MIKTLFNKLGITDRASFFAFVVQFLKFGIVGVSNTIVSTGITYLFIYISTDLIYLGQILGFIFGVMNGYYWNNRFTFKQDEQAQDKPFKEHLKLLGRVYMAYSVTMVLGLCLTWVMRNIIGISEWHIPIIMIFICTPINFLMNKFYAYRQFNSNSKL